MAQANLYPPKIEKTYQNAFQEQDVMKIYFGLSEYNNIDLIDTSRVQLTLKRQDTGENVLNSTNGIIIKQMFVDNTVTTTDKYYIEVYCDDLKPIHTIDGTIPDLDDPDFGEVYYPYTEYFSLQSNDATFYEYKIVIQEGNKRTLYKLDNTTQEWLRVTDHSDPGYPMMDMEIKAEINHFRRYYYYQAQLRFTSIDLKEKTSNLHSKDPNNLKAMNDLEYRDWFIVNADKFSEWSKITLCKAIHNVHVRINDKQQNWITEDTILYTKDRLLDIDLDFYYTQLEKYGGDTINSLEDPIINQYLDSYQLELYDVDSYKGRKKIFDSGLVYVKTQKTQNIKYKIPRVLQAGRKDKDKEYYLIVNYTLSSGFSNSHLFRVKVKPTTDSFPGYMLLTPDANKGQVRVDIYSKKISGEYVNFNRNVRIIRSSSESNFTDWDIMADIEMDNGYAIYWIDSTCESDIWYKYGAQITYTKTNSKKEDVLISSDVYIEEQPIRLALDDAFLINNYTQLRMKYNPNISSFKYVVKDSLQETLGSQFPFTTRSGKVKYRSFPISGLIARSMDDIHTFQDRFPLYTQNITIALNNDYNNRYDINSEYDMLAERKFREAVMEFLYSPDAFLFKSPSEGNILVKLSDVSFTPLQEQGRRLYSFSANANEIDFATVENYDKYKIQKNELDLTYDWIIDADRYYSVFNRELDNDIDYLHTDRIINVTPKVGAVVYKKTTKEHSKNLADLLMKPAYLEKNDINYGINFDYVKIKHPYLDSGLYVDSSVVDHDLSKTQELLQYTGVYDLN